MAKKQASELSLDPDEDRPAEGQPAVRGGAGRDVLSRRQVLKRLPGLRGATGRHRPLQPRPPDRHILGAAAKAGVEPEAMVGLSSVVQPWPAMHN